MTGNRCTLDVCRAGCCTHEPVRDWARDWYLCYDVTATKAEREVQPVERILRDTLGTVVFTVSDGERSACQPSRWPRLAGRRTCSATKITPGRARSRNVRERVKVVTDFGELHVDTRTADRASRPAAEGIAIPPALDPDHGVDHFKAYDVKLARASSFRRA